MKVANFSWGLGAAILLASAAPAGADEPFSALDDSPQFMLYVQKPVGAARHKSTGPLFGFAVDRSARIFDLRVAPFDHGAIMLNGFRLTGETRGLGLDSYGSDSWDNPWVWIALGLGGALGVSCATDNWPCDGGGYDGSNNDYRVPGT